MIRIGVVGLGWWGKQIVKCLSGSERYKVTAGFDIAHNSVAGFADDNNFVLTETFDALLRRSDVDAIAVVTPHGFHEQQVLDAFAAGKHVFCEKPLTMSARGAETMLAACARHGSTLGIGHERRFEPALEELRKLLTSGQLGRLLYLDSNVSHNIFRSMDPATNWRRDPKHAPAGAWTALGIHLSDLMVSLAGQPQRVAAHTRSQLFTPPSEDFVSAEIDFADAVRGRITCLSTPPFYGRFTIYGDQGWVEVTEGGNVDKELPSVLVHCGADGNRVTRSYPAINTVKLNFESWADALEGRGTYRFTPEQLLANIRIFESVVKSAASGGSAITF